MSDVNAFLSCWQWRRWTFNGSELLKTDLVDCWLHCNVEEGWGLGLLPLWCEALRHWTYWREWRNCWGCWEKLGPAHSWKQWVTPAGTDACWGSVHQTEARPRPHFGARLEERWGNYGRTTWHGVGAAGMAIRGWVQGGMWTWTWIHLEWKWKAMVPPQTEGRKWRLW